MRISDFGGSMPDQYVDNASIVEMAFSTHRPDDDGLVRIELKATYRPPPVIDGEVIEIPNGPPYAISGDVSGGACTCDRWPDGEPHWHVGALRVDDQ